MAAGEVPMSAPQVLRPADWTELVTGYQQPDLRRSIGQILSSFVPFAAILAAMLASLRVGYWPTLILALPAAGLLVRIFIIQHDCGHGAFFKSVRANDGLGFVCGVLTLTPYRHWRHNHAVHHRSAGNLARRGVGAIFTLTVREYVALSRWRRLLYRIYRHPLVLFGVGPVINFVILQRFWSPKAPRQERAGVLWTNLAIAGLTVGSLHLIGSEALILVLAPTLSIAFTIGTWLFYVQHQFEETYWARDEDWSYTLAALKGSSYYQLPEVLRWFTGNIGFHHIHHLSPKIPNYLLKRCHDENPSLRPATILTLASSLRTASLHLWDEETERLVGFGHRCPVRQETQQSIVPAGETD